MCNLSEAIEERGYDRGIEEGRAAGIAEGKAAGMVAVYKSLGYSFAQTLETVAKSISGVKELDVETVVQRYYYLAD